MLSNMESNAPTPDEAAAALREAEVSRDRLASGVRLPPRFHFWIGVAIAIQIGTAAIGIAEQSLAGATLAAVGVLLFLVEAFAQLRAFRRLNGVWLGGLVSKVVLGTGTFASTVYTLAFAAATWAAFEHQWWLTVLCAAAGGVGYAAGGIRWVRAYREDPLRHGRGESTVMLVAMAVPVVAAGILLVVNR